MAQSLVDLMTLMQHYGPQLAESYGVAYRNVPATTVAHLVSQMLEME